MARRGTCDYYPVVSPEYAHYERIRTTGTVTELEAGNHQAVRYTFHVLGNAYSGVGRAGFGNPEFAALSVGQPITVYYKSDDPSESYIGVPGELIKNEITPVLLAGLVFPSFALAVWTFRVPRFKRWLLS